MQARPTALRDLAAELGRDCEGDPAFMVRGVAPLERAGPGDLSFVRTPRYAKLLASSAAGAVIVPADVDPGSRPAIRSPNPAFDFARAVEHLMPRRRPAPGVHATAWVAPGAVVDASAWVGPGCVVGEGCRIGPRTLLRASVTLYDDVEVGADCELHAGVVLREETRVGDRVVLQAGVVVGGEGFGFVPDERGRAHRVPHVGRVVLEDDVEVGPNTSIDRATLGETRVGAGTKIDALVCIAHNCEIEENVVIVAQSGLAGSTQVGRGAVLMARVGVGGHLRIGEGAFVGGRAGVHKDVKPGSRVWGTPQMEERTWHRASAALVRLPEALRRLRAVERKLGLPGPKGAGARE